MQITKHNLKVVTWICDLTQYLEKTSKHFLPNGGLFHGDEILHGKQVAFGKTLLGRMHAPMADLPAFLGRRVGSNGFLMNDSHLETC